MIRAVPIYDYRCDACGHAFSAVQSYADATLESCPQCGARPRKVLTTPAIVFKGSGWYRTDNRASSEAGRADAKEAAAEAKDARAAGAASDAKAEAPAEGKKDSKAAKAEKAEKAGAEKAGKAEKSGATPKSEPAS
jgi:putative FmdB family regulatory protein